MSTKIDMIRRPGYPGLYPYGANDMDVCEKLRYNTLFSVKVSQPRSPKFHRKYMGVCRKILKGNNSFSSAEAVSDYLLLKCGHYDRIIVKKKEDGTEETILIPAHINFDAKDNLWFSQYYNQAVIHAAALLECTVEEIDNNSIFEEE